MWSCHNGFVGEVFGAALEMALSLVGNAWSAAFRSGRGYSEGRPAGPLTIAAAATSAALFAPMTVGSCLVIRAMFETMGGDDLFWFMGLILLIPAISGVALALCAMAGGVTVGAWLLLDRPFSRLSAGVMALAAAFAGFTIVEIYGWEAYVVGWSTILLSALLLVLVATHALLPVLFPPPVPAAPGAEVPPRPTRDRSTGHEPRGRFVL